MPVALAILRLDDGNPDRLVYELATRLDRDLVQPTLVVNKPHGAYLDRLDGRAPVVVLGRDGRRSGIYPAVELARAIRRLRPRVVLSFGRFNVVASLGHPVWPRDTRLAVRPGVHLSPKLAEWSKGSRASRAKAMLHRRSVTTADLVVCQSAAVSDDLAEIGVPLNRLATIGNGIDVDDARRRVARARPVLPGRPCLVAVGRLTAQKGFDVLIEAMAELRRHEPEAELTIIGGGALQAALSQQITALGLDRAVHLAGRSADPLPAMAAADVFVLSSRYEGQANVTLEALACGTPVVAPRAVSGVREVVREGENGWLADAGTPSALATALRRACSEVPRRDSAALIADCRARHSIERTVEEYQSLLLRLSAAPGRGVAARSS